MTLPTSTKVPPGTWAADPVHSDISFTVRHMGVGRVRGTFALTAATLIVGKGGDVPVGRVHAVIDASSVQTGNAQRDRHVRSADFLDVMTHPTMEFRSTEIRDFDADTMSVVGELTLHGVTRTVTLATELLGVVADPSGVDRTGFAATASISRADFGVDIQLVLGTGNAVVADAIEVTIDIEFTFADGDD